VMTGRESRLATKPSCMAPIATCSPPAMAVTAIASVTYSPVPTSVTAPEPGRQDQHVEGLRPDGQLPRASEERIHEQRDEPGVEAVDGRQARNHRVGHALRNEHHPDGEARDGVSPKRIYGVVGQPLGEVDGIPKR
jgi:hypothetical protein